MVYSSKNIVLLILSALASNLSCEPVFADDRAALDHMFGQFSGQAFRNSFFSEQIRQSSSMDDLAELERKRLEERAEKKDLRRQREEIEEKDKLERAARIKHMFDRSDDLSNSSKSFNSANNSYSTPILDNDFTFDFEKHVLQSDLFSDRARDSDHSGHSDLERTRDDQIRDHRPGDDNSREDSRARRDRAKLPGRVIEVTGDWVPDKLDPTSNGGFTIAPDNGSPVPYKLNGHVDIQRGRPWNDND